jgi:hypothetical protein
VPAGAYYVIHGLVVQSEVEFPFATARASVPDLRFTVGPGSSGEGPPSFSRADDPETPWAVEHWIDDRLIVEFGTDARFEVGKDLVRLIADQPRDLDQVVHLFLDHVLPRVVALRGDLMLHGAACEAPSGRAFVFVGATGAGKSSLATALGTQGWPLLDDDGVRLLTGPVRAVPGYARVRLSPDAAQALVPSLSAGRPTAEVAVKRSYPVDGQVLALATGPRPVAAVFELGRAPTPRPAVERIGFAEALEALTRHGFHLEAAHEQIARTAFERTSDLVAEVPVFRLGVPDGLHRLEQVSGALEAVDRRLS